MFVHIWESRAKSGPDRTGEGARRPSCPFARSTLCKGARAPAEQRRRQQTAPSTNLFGVGWAESAWASPATAAAPRAGRDGPAPPPTLGVAAKRQGSSGPPTDGARQTREEVRLHPRRRHLRHAPGKGAAPGSAGQREPPPRRLASPRPLLEAPPRDREDIAPTPKPINSAQKQERKSCPPARNEEGRLPTWGTRRRLLRAPLDSGWGRSEGDGARPPRRPPPTATPPAARETIARPCTCPEPP
ncbi:basic proline-rich protein-like [Rhineura floridana]|uniref:basic proline-rich protein-like n=1 Tax=Rhineura floridana TaxID=261503 RepID=UPI002AC8192F|nr:basic proline-rich protein-like [Rhineura floridana]